MTNIIPLSELNIKKAETTIELLEASAAAQEIIDDSGLESFINTLGLVKKWGKLIEEKRKSDNAEANEIIKANNAKWKPYTERLEKLSRSIDAKIIPYQQEKARREAEAEREKNMQIASNLVAAGMDEKALEAIDRNDAVSEKDYKKTSTGFVTNTLSTRWVVEIVDPEQVPREYCEPNQTRLNAAVKLGKREIAGCKIYEKTFSVTRA
ncbi:hypothetical protein NO1_1831 [Candidatus Termititenax aidoneus]|uniref:Uncharacterized protein n=1 Tax=Termititenax aidoneus TaxID=2218524 RepID=A0A388TDW3_TERA1|nr:hypothetical protein NO1_1831 [Candidatus Termititenax aidoneus]